MNDALTSEGARLAADIANKRGDLHLSDTQRALLDAIASAQDIDAEDRDDRLLDVLRAGLAAEDVPPDEPWDVDVFPLPLPLDTPPDEALTLSMVGIGPYVVAYSPSSRPMVDPQDAAPILAELVLEAQERAERQAQCLRVRHETLVAPLARASGLPVSCAPDLPALDRSIMDLNAHRSLPNIVHAPTVRSSWSAWRLPADVLDPLMAAALAMYKARPWKRVGDRQPLEIRTADGVWWASVLQPTGAGAGLVVYPSEGDLRRNVLLGFRALYRCDGPQAALTFLPADAVPQATCREVEERGWLPRRDAYPMLVLMGGAAASLEIRVARGLTQAMDAVPQALKSWSRRRLPNTVAEPLTFDAGDVTVVYRGGIESVFPMEEMPRTALVRGDAAEPGAAVEAYVEIRTRASSHDADGPNEAGGRGTRQERDARPSEDEPEGTWALVAAENSEMLDGLRAWLEGRQVPAAEIELALENVDWFAADYLGWHKSVPLRAVTELELRDYLYDYLPRKVEADWPDVRGAPTHLGWLFGYLVSVGLEAPWSGPICADDETFEVRWWSCPEGHWWDPDVAAWRSILADDLEARAFIPGERWASGGRWGATMGHLEAELREEAGRRFLLWREEALAAGAEDYNSLRKAIRAHQRAWETSVDPTLGMTPRDAIVAERKERAGGRKGKARGRTGRVGRREG